MNTVRIFNLLEVLKKKQFHSGTILEIGSYFGSFSLALQKLGYSVTAVDRYDNYGNAFSKNIELMKEAGVQVVSVSRENEEKIISSLPTFDCVISCAVIEHIPHTPRLFLNLLKSKLKQSGIIALDTPNVARYWNRIGMCLGKSPYQSISDQFYCEIPYEGHHREYTGNELIWMLEQLGFKNIDLCYFDYNCLQFDSLTSDHIKCLLSIIEDPEKSDTVLVCGEI